MKETSRRFSEADTLGVNATDLDRELAIDADYVSIQNDMAEYKTSWDAAGSLIDWKMVHYDVQLHGGIVLHEGKIAEMQTGEGKTLVSTLPAYFKCHCGIGRTHYYSKQLSSTSGLRVESTAFCLSWTHCRLY